MYLCMWSIHCNQASPWVFPLGLQHVHFSEGLRGAAVLHPEEAVLAEWPTLWGPPLPRHRRLPLLSGQQDRARGLEETSGESVCTVKEFQLIRTNRYWMTVMIIKSESFKIVECGGQLMAAYGLLSVGSKPKGLSVSARWWISKCLGQNGSSICGFQSFHADCTFVPFQPSSGSSWTFAKTWRLITTVIYNQSHCY